MAVLEAEWASGSSSAAAARQGDAGARDADGAAGAPARAEPVQRPPTVSPGLRLLLDQAMMLVLGLAQVREAGWRAVLGSVSAS